MAIRYDAEARTLACSVRDLVEQSDDRFTGSIAATRARREIGRAVHEEYQAEQQGLFAGYRAEVAVSYDCVVDGVAATVSGRIDGVYVEGEVAFVEEVKSVLQPGSELDAISPLRRQQFSEQVALYGVMLAAQQPPIAPRIQPVVVLVSVADGTRLDVPVDVDDYGPQLIEQRIRRILSQLAEAEEEIARRQQLAKTLPFAFGGYRPHQESMVTFLASQAAAGKHAIVEAPTGIGKTAAALYGLGRDALANGSQLFYVTPKNTQHQLVLETASRWREQGHDVRVVSLRAKAKMCLNDVLACHQDLCPYAKDYAAKMESAGLPERLWTETVDADDGQEQQSPKRKRGAGDRPASTGNQTSPDAASDQREHPGVLPLAHASGSVSEPPDQPLFRIDADDGQKKQSPKRKRGAADRPASPGNRTSLDAASDPRDHPGVLPLAHASGSVSEQPTPPAARTDTVVTPERLKEIGRSEQVCPFELGLDLSESADVIVGDYNYVFDPVVALKRYFGPDADPRNLGAKPRLVIDEAHALYDRGCDYYSPALWMNTFRRAREAAGSLTIEIGPKLREWAEEVLTEIEERVASVDVPEREDGVELPRPFEAEVFADWRERVEGLFIEYLLQRRIQREVVTDDPLIEAFFQFVRFEYTVQLEGPEFTHLVVRGMPDSADGEQQRGPLSPDATRRLRSAREAGAGSEFGLKIHCADPSKQIGKRLSEFHSAAAVSATLTPMHYWHRVLGFPKRRTDTLSLPSPFPRENLCVVVDRSVSTTYRNRSRYADRIAQTILDAAALQPGNYLAAFPSYAYLRDIVGRLAEYLPPHWPRRDVLLAQEPSMDELAREAFLATLDDVPTNHPRILAIVQGGIFSEGVDYPGDRCIGAFIIGPALPRVGLWQELKRRYFEREEGDGFAYAYLFPGMTKVIQTAGRVIRRETDQGFVALMDDRFARSEYQATFPRWWYADHPGELADHDGVKAALREWRQDWG